MKTRIVIFVILACVVLSIFVMAQSKNVPLKASEITSEGCGDKVRNLVLCIEPIKSEYALNEPVNVQVSLKTISGQSTRPLNSSNNYSLEVKGPDGKTLDYRETSHSFITRNWISGGGRDETGSSKTQSKLFFVNNLFDLSKPGTYSVIATRKIPTNDGNFEIRSNSASFKILEK